jgi:hypothetical protein
MTLWAKITDKDYMITLVLVVILSAALIAWMILDGVMIGQRGGKIYPAYPWQLKEEHSGHGLDIIYCTNPLQS